MGETENSALLIIRVMKAPSELVWGDWTNPEHITAWWGIAGFSSTINIM